MKRRLLSLFIIFVLSMTIMCPVSARLGMSINAIYNQTTGCISVNGTVYSDADRIPMTLKLFEPDGALAAAGQTVAMRDKDDDVSYVFEDIYLSHLAPGGDYEVTVSGHFINDEVTTIVSVPGADEQLELLKELISSASPYGVVKDNASDFGISDTVFLKMETDGIEMFNSLFAGKTYEIPDAIVTEEDAKITKEVFMTVCSDIISSKKIAEFADITTQSKLNTWIDNYYGEYGFDKDSDATAESEKELTVYVNLVKNQSEYLNRIIAGKEDLKSPAEIQDLIYKEALLTTISTQSDYRVINLIKEFNTFFPINSMSDKKLSERCSAISGNKYSTFDEVVSAINDTDDDSSKDSSSKGGGSSWGSAGSAVIAPVTKNPEVKNNFTDIEGVSWASDAINYLSERNIINGRGNGIFAPNDKITRAEFIKVLLLASNLSPKASSERVFTDVNPDAWYAPYITAAYEAGITTGTGDGRFLPDEEITRQDISVLLCRALNIVPNGANSVFTDTENISEYAKAYVAELSSRKIIRGTGNNLFMPLSSASRAEAAQMIYNALIQK